MSSYIQNTFRAGAIITEALETKKLSTDILEVGELLNAGNVIVDGTLESGSIFANEVTSNIVNALLLQAGTGNIIDLNASCVNVSGTIVSFDIQTSSLYSDQIGGNILNVGLVEASMGNISGNLTAGNIFVGNIFADNINVEVSIDNLESATANIAGNLTAENIFAGNGSVSAPSISYKSLRTSGMYVSNSTALGVSVNGISSVLFSPNVVLTPSMVLSSKFIMAGNVSHLPQPTSSVITIPDGYSLLIVGSLDLQGNRLSCAGNNDIIGNGFDSSTLYSTGLSSGNALINTTGAIQFHGISIGCPAGTRALSITGDGICTLHSIKFGTPTIPCASVGNINSYTSITMTHTTFANVQRGITFGGSSGSIAIIDTNFSGSLSASEPYVRLQSSLVVSNQFRIFTSSMNVPTGSLGVLYEGGVTIPSDSFYMDNVYFSGSGTYVQGIDYTSNTALIRECVGITNSLSVGELYMLNNATGTTPLGANTWTKVAGTTTLNPLSIKFDSPISNRLRYTGTQTTLFRASATLSVTADHNGSDVRFRIYKSGTPITSSEQFIDIPGSGDYNHVSIISLVSLATNEYIELWCQYNTVSTSTITVRDLVVDIVRVR